MKNRKRKIAAKKKKKNKDLNASGHHVDTNNTLTPKRRRFARMRMIGTSSTKMKRRLRGRKKLKARRLKGMRRMLRGRKRKSLQGEAWNLVKKKDGTCLCTQKPHGRVVVKKFETQTECENDRNGC